MPKAWYKDIVPVPAYKDAGVERLMVHESTNVAKDLWWNGHCGELLGGGDVYNGERGV